MSSISDHDNGWIKIYRKISNWEWYHDSKTFHLFMHLLINANHQPKKWRGVVIERGQILTGRHKLKEQTGISERSIRTSLERLKSTSEITINSTNHYSIITLCNYSTYQTSLNENDQQNDQLNDQQPTSNRPATDHKQELKNVKNVKKYKKQYGEFQNVLLSDEEYSKLQQLYNSALEQKIERLSVYMESKGKKYKSHYATILSWEQKNNPQSSNQPDRRKQEEIVNDLIRQGKLLPL